MANDQVLAVLLNWRRPANIPQIIAALRGQSVSTHITLVECSPGDAEFGLPPDVLALADTVFSVNRNIGPCSRFIPPLAMPQFRYAFFAVDDWLPGPKCIEWMLKTDREFNGDVATVGQDGRHVVGESLSGRRVKMQSCPVAVDVVTSSELIETAAMCHAARFQWELAAEFGSDVSLFEDDLILQFGVQRGCESPCYLTPAPPDELHSWRMKKLPAPHALSARPDHRERRGRFVKQAMQLGWRSLV